MGVNNISINYERSKKAEDSKVSRFLFCRHTVVRSGLDIELKLDSRVSYKVVTEDGVERICNIRLYEGDGWSTAEDEIEVETPAV